MNAPVYRDTSNIDTRREWLRKALPPGAAGFVLEDIDLVIRRFHPYTDPSGRFALIEFKWDKATLGIAQKKTFELINTVLALSGSKKYAGFFVINWPSTDGGMCERCKRAHPRQIDFQKRPAINGQEIAWEQLIEFLKTLELPQSE